MSLICFRRKRGTFSFSAPLPLSIGKGKELLQLPVRLFSLGLGYRGGRRREEKTFFFGKWEKEVVGLATPSFSFAVLFFI